MLPPNKNDVACWHCGREVIMNGWRKTHGPNVLFETGRIEGVETRCPKIKPVSLRNIDIPFSL